MKKLLLIITTIALTLSITQVYAQQMLLQVVGGGYRLDGPTSITFTSVTASTSADTTSEVSIRDITSGGYTNPPTGADPGFISIEDQNGGSPFDLYISVENEFKHTTYPSIYTISNSNFYTKNKTSTTEPETVTINGLENGFTLNATLNTYTALTQDRLLGSGTGQQPGKWKFFPGFKLEIPNGTPTGTYQTTITFTII